MGEGKTCQSGHKFLTLRRKRQLPIQIFNPNVSVTDMNINELSACYDPPDEVTHSST